MGAKSTAEELGHRVARDLPRIEEIDDGETGSFGRLELDESLYPLTVLPMVHVRPPSAKVKPPVFRMEDLKSAAPPPRKPAARRVKAPPPLPRIVFELEEPDTNVVSANDLRRLRAKAKLGEEARIPPEELEEIWDEAVGPKPELDTPSGIRALEPDE